MKKTEIKTPFEEATEIDEEVYKLFKSEQNRRFENKNTFLSAQRLYNGISFEEQLNN